MEEDLDRLATLLETRYSYLKLRGFDYRMRDPPLLDAQFEGETDQCRWSLARRNGTVQAAMGPTVAERRIL